MHEQGRTKHGWTGKIVLGKIAFSILLLFPHVFRLSVL